jgi:hypothetical protein
MWWGGDHCRRDGTARRRGCKGVEGGIGRADDMTLSSGLYLF